MISLGTKIAIFKGKKTRKTIHNNEWWFVINDVVEVLTDSVQVSGYIKDIRRRDEELNKGGVANCPLPSYSDCRKFG
ncbi:MAG: prophage antirepressor [uncultured bacterium]|nr:MAG: prophage antirepressor [uncultured bacterium]